MSSVRNGTLGPMWGRRFPVAVFTDRPVSARENLSTCERPRESGRWRRAGRPVRATAQALGAVRIDKQLLFGDASVKF